MGNNSVKLFEIGPMIQEEMSFKDISYLELFCSVEQNSLYNFGRGHHEEHFCETILNLELWLWRKYNLTTFFYLELWQPLCSVEQYRLCSLGRRHHEAQFCVINLNLDRCFRRCCLKIFLI